MTPSKPLDLIGVGAPIMDIVVSVPDDFLAHAGGEKGGMVMVDADEMARLLALLPTKPAMSTGGSAANTTFNTARLGLRAAFIGKLGNDDAADAYKARFASAGVDTSRFKHAAMPNGRCLALTTPDAQRTMRTCLGAHGTFSPEDVSPSDFEGARHVHIEGYVVFNSKLADAILDGARASGCTLSLDLASFEVVRESREWLLGQLRKGIDVVFSNEDEIRALFPDAADANTVEDYRALGARLAEFGGVAAVKLGKDGAWIVRGKGGGVESHRIAPVRVTDAVDSNGAGDAWGAGFLSGWLREKPLPVCGEIASLLGAETVRHMGPLVPDAHWPQTSSRATELLR
ncbi:sugar/nucleoside kinase (ribokinase family) [Ereboglobus sp. PH5-10]|uniref:adenosine kinase n=1 Tax=Ereboglobus sp. PH5-10 TaxID=2940629 RepID=UPI002404EE4A|nr:adenosine kinase [Ereboglobus sp. PH5-10]MDF9827517.1 sugar/nucleoside kinase (ribokinase family) [Ereboglobus sp. PH5-10]